MVVMSHRILSLRTLSFSAAVPAKYRIQIVAFCRLVIVSTISSIEGFCSSSADFAAAILPCSRSIAARSSEPGGYRWMSHFECSICCILCSSTSNALDHTFHSVTRDAFSVRLRFVPAILFKYKTPKWQSGIAMPMAAIARSVFPMLTVHGEHAIGVGSHRAKSEKTIRS